MSASGTDAAARLDLSARAPVAERRPHETEIHGRRRDDAYAYLRDRDDPAVFAYLHAENAYTDAVMAPTAALQTRLYDEMLSHIVQTDLSVPYRVGDYWYYSRTQEGRQYPIHARKRGEDGPEEITLDVNALAEGHPFLGIGAYAVSPNARYLAYTVDTTGYRQYTLHVKDLSTGDVLAEAIPRVNEVVWAADDRTLFFVTEDDVSKRRDRFWRHELGASESTLLYHERDERYDLAAMRTNDRAYALLGAFSKSTTEWRVLPLDRPLEAPRVVVPRSEGHRSSLEHRDGWFYLLTNRGADDFRLVRTPVDAPDEAHWEELVAQRPGVHLSDVDMFRSFAVLHGRSGGFGNLEILDVTTGELRPVPMPETVHSVFAHTNLEYDTDAYRFAYASLVTPQTVFEIDLATGERRVLKATQVPGYEPARYASELVHATARDGTRVPVSLVSRTDVPRDGSAPLLLYAYGSYGLSMDPAFSPSRLALLDRGVVFAIAHVRGGGELGEAWRTSGHLRQKINTFTDFVDVAEHLIAQRYTAADRLAAQGGSAGGLLMGAISNDRPDLFATILSHVPFVDVLNTMLDASLPLTTSEYLEWGDPNDAGDYDYIARYSPYDNVCAQAYPATLVKVAINDSQVPYWEGAKLVAKIRAMQTGTKPLLLHVNFGAGHGGASGRYDHLREIAFDYAFVLSTVKGIDP